MLVVYGKCSNNMLAGERTDELDAAHLRPGGPLQDQGEHAQRQPRHHAEHYKVSQPVPSPTQQQMKLIFNLAACTSLSTVYMPEVCVACRYLGENKLCMSTRGMLQWWYKRRTRWRRIYPPPPSLPTLPPSSGVRPGETVKPISAVNAKLFLVYPMRWSDAWSRTAQIRAVPQLLRC